MSVKAPHQRANWHDAFDAQMALWRWYRSPMGRLYMEDNARVNLDSLEYEGTRNLMMQLYGSEKSRLIDCDPIFVSAEMCEVIEAAASLFKPEPLLETDLVTPRGFLYFERPFDVPDRFDDPVTIAGASWNRLYASDDSATVDEVNARIQDWSRNNRDKSSLVELEEEVLADIEDIRPYGIGISIYCDTDPHPAWKEGNPQGVIMRELYGSNLPPRIPFHITPWYFDMTFDGNEWDTLGKPTGAQWWWSIIQVTLRLMQQRISVKNLHPLERQARKEAKRLGARPDTEVVVVRLRREAGEANEPTGESANYSHRFIVGGHWRNQPYPSEKIHRQIWISPYVKGPKDRPLIVRPKRVYQWDR